MDLKRFQDCSAAFGAARHRWPPQEHGLYDRFSGTSEGLAILAEAERADRFLDALVPAAPDPRLVHNVSDLAKLGWRRFATVATALAASAVLGFIVGFVQVQGAADTGIAARLLRGPQSLLEIGL